MRVSGEASPHAPGPAWLPAVRSEDSWSNAWLPEVRPQLNAMQPATASMLMMLHTEGGPDHYGHHVPSCANEKEQKVPSQRAAHAAGLLTEQSPTHHVMPSLVTTPYACPGRHAGAKEDVRLQSLTEPDIQVVKANGAAILRVQVGHVRWVGRRRRQRTHLHSHYDRVSSNGHMTFVMIVPRPLCLLLRWQIRCSSAPSRGHGRLRRAPAAPPSGSPRSPPTAPTPGPQSAPAFTVPGSRRGPLEAQQHCECHRTSLDNDCATCAVSGHAVTQNP